MNDLMVFNNEMFGSIRGIEINGEPWLVGKDVSEALGYQNASKALADHVDAEDKLNNGSLSSLGQRGGWLINESGLYSLILSSKLPNAKRFKRWVTSEVLPTLRKTGKYEYGSRKIPQTYSDALRMLADEVDKNTKLISENKKLTDNNVMLENKIDNNQYKVDFYDQVRSFDDLLTWEQAAKIIGVGPNKLTQTLREIKIIKSSRSSRNIPYQKYMNSGFFKVKRNYYNGKCKPGNQTLVTPKGLQFLNKFIVPIMKECP